jgi:hypothetical protein
MKRGANDVERETVKVFTKFFLVFFLGIFLIGLASATSYYVNATTGNDSNNGTTPDFPKKTLAGVAALTLVIGDNIFFERGQTWFNEGFLDATLGVNGVVVDAYGSGANPKFYGTLDPTTITWEQGSGEWYYNKTSAPPYVFYNGAKLTLGTSDLVLANQYYWNTTSNRTYVNISKNPNGELIYIPVIGSGISILTYKNLL